MNLIGEHTDYNGGLVVPAAVDQYMYLSAAINGSNTIRVNAIDLQETVSISLSDLKKTGHLWADFLVGILIALQQRGFHIAGFDCALTSDVPIGAGMSSSSALECAFLVGMRELFDLPLSRWQLIEISQYSNHNFLGIMGGILDQFASLYGEADKIMMLDCTTRQHTEVVVPASEYCWLLVNTNVQHNHLNSGYNTRVAECQAALSEVQKVYPTADSLSDIVEIGQLDSVVFTSDLLRNRATYVVEENTRVRHFTEALSSGAFEQCGSLLYESHSGLSHKYDVSCQELDFLVEILRDSHFVLGSRMMGGGFGGCTINLIEQGSVEQIRKLVVPAYEAQFGRSPSFYDVRIGAGAGPVVVSN